MSIVSDRHSFVTYISTGKDRTQAFTGQRLSVVRFKKDKAGNKARESAAVSIPRAVLGVEDYVVLGDYINGWFHSVQDEIIREACVAGKSEITSEEIDIAHVKAYLTQQAAGERLTGDVIKEWFVAELQDSMLVAFAEKLEINAETATEEQVKKLEQMCAVYRDKFASMAGGRTMYDSATQKKLLRALELTDCTEGIGAKLQAKLQAMTEVSVEEMLGL